jgi:hypothetical protein
MAAALPASIVNAVLGLELGSTDQGAGNRFSLEDVTVASRDDGALAIKIRTLEAASLRLSSGPHVLEVGRLALHDLVGQVRMAAGRPHLSALEAAAGELSGIDFRGPAPAPAALQASQAPASSWCLGPLAAADGRIRAEILDAHLLFDADVTVPIRQGQVNFNEATVEHVGPDSRMGVSRLGVYVDAPNGRSYLYQFSSTPVAGAGFERRGALLGPWVSDRGHLRLQAFAEGLLRQAGIGLALGFTEQARLLFDRTAVSGDVQLGDGRFAAPGVQADVVGRADGRNAVRLHSQAVGRAVTVEMPSLSVRNAALNWKDLQLGCDELTGPLTFRLFVEGGQLRFALALASMEITGLRLVLE